MRHLAFLLKFYHVAGGIVSSLQICPHSILIFCRLQINATTHLSCVVGVVKFNQSSFDLSGIVHDFFTKVIVSSSGLIVCYMRTIGKVG
jgi:hypothetical protein